MSASGPKAYTIQGGDLMPAEMVSPLHLAPVEDKATLDDALQDVEAGLVA